MSTKSCRFAHRRIPCPDPRGRHQNTWSDHRPQIAAFLRHLAFPVRYVGEVYLLTGKSGSGTQWVHIPGKTIVRYVSMPASRVPKNSAEFEPAIRPSTGAPCSRAWGNTRWCEYLNTIGVSDSPATHNETESNRHQSQAEVLHDQCGACSHKTRD